MSTRQSMLRLIFRWIHIVFSIPIVGYIYGPFEELPKYAPVVRRVFVPVIVVSGLWMWKGHLVRRLIPKRSFRQNVTLGRVVGGLD
jgi:hypothetical protein